MSFAARLSSSQSSFACIEPLESRSLFSAGALDPTFGFGGKLTASFPPNDSASALQPDGKIVVAGFDVANREMDVARFNPDGSYDTTFDGDGKLTIPGLSPGAIAIQPDGKIDIGLGGVLGVLRLNPDGSIDTTFDGDGIASIHIGSASHNNDTTSLAIEPDGKILVGGADVTDSPINWSLVRFNADGSLDTSFQIQTLRTGRDSSVHNLALLPDGDFLAVGDGAINGTAGPLVMRFNNDGTIDTNFGVNGQALVNLSPFYQGGGDFALSPDGKIIVSGNTQTTLSAIGVARLNPNGSLDTTFNNDGVSFIIASTRGTTAANDIKLQPDGKILLAAVTTPDTIAGDIFTVLRLTANGDPDPTFGTNGKITARFGPDEDFEPAQDIFVQPDGNILAIGTSFSIDNFNVSNLIMARFPGDSTTPPDNQNQAPGNSGPHRQDTHHRHHPRKPHHDKRKHH